MLYIVRMWDMSLSFGGLEGDRGVEGETVSEELSCSRLCQMIYNGGKKEQMEYIL